MFFIKLKWWWQLTIISLLSLVIYLPIVGNSFVNDDFIVLKKVCIDGRLNTDGFFRPLSDISIWLTWKVAGLRPWAFYITGILVHALSTVLLIRLCLRWQWTANEQIRYRFALLSGAIFLTYPFHNESVAWILGRGALIANTLGIAALLILINPGKGLFKKIAVCLCYFIGLGFYETIIVLPGMVFIYLAADKTGIRQTGRWMAALIITLLLHIIIRIRVSGSLAGSYGANFFDIDWANYLTQFPKALGRVLLPPVNHAQLMIGISLGVLAIVAGVAFYLQKRLAGNRQASRFLFVVVACFLLAMLVPAIAGVSTRTSESDRFLHFPSYFFAMIAAFAMMILLQASRWLGVVVTVFLCTQICCLEVNNLNWRRASGAVTDILAIAKENVHTQQSLYIIGLPDEINGAFVFRVGFQEALMINNIDASQVHILSRYSRDEEEQATLPRVSEPGNNTLLVHYKVRATIQETHIPLNSNVVYWDGKKWTEIR